MFLIFVLSMIILQLNELYNTIFTIQQFYCLTETNLLFFMLLLISMAYFGFTFNARNFFRTMLCMEIIYVSIITSSLTIANNFDDLAGFIFALLLVIIAAIES